MRVLVAYASRHGATQGIAERIAATLSAAGLDVDVSAMRDVREPEGYDAFILGSAVYMFRWLKDFTRFVHRHEKLLATRPLWLFSSGPLGDRSARAPQPDPKDVGAIRRAVAPRDHRVFAGSFDRATADFDGMGIVDRTVVRRFLPDGDWRDWPEIEAWARGIAAALARDPVSGHA